MLPPPSHNEASEPLAAVPLTKWLTSRGICLRKEAKRLVLAEKILVDGVVASFQTQVRENSTVVLDGNYLWKIVLTSADYILYKPVGVTCTTKRDDSTSWVHFFPSSPALLSVGRLDKASEGLLLITNDGAIVNPLMKSEFAHQKEYEVVVNKDIPDECLENLRRGVAICSGLTKPAQVERMAANAFRITIVEGKYRQIRKMCSTLGFNVRSLKRMRLAQLTLGTLAPGEWRPLTPDEISVLNVQL